MEENTGNEPLREGGGAGDNVPPGPGNTGENEVHPEDQPKSEIEKFREITAAADIDADKLLKEFADEIEASLKPKMVDILGKAVDSLNSTVDNALAVKVKPLVEGAVQAQLPFFIEAVEKALLSKYATLTGGGAPPTPGQEQPAASGGMPSAFNLMSLLTNPQAAPAIEAIAKFFRPAPDEGRLAKDFSLLFNGMKMGLNLKIAPEMIDNMRDEFTKIGGGGGAAK